MVAAGEGARIGHLLRCEVGSGTSSRTADRQRRQSVPGTGVHFKEKAVLALFDRLIQGMEAAMIAGQLSHALNIMQLASPLLPASAILSFLAVLIPAKPSS
jgi:hypothetical protein